MKTHQEWIEKCIDMAVKNVEDGQMPFASVVIRNGEEVAAGVNDGKATNDPTAHGEIRAIQAAGKALRTTDLSDCVLYTNCEPCPMCLGALYWSGIKEVYYGLSVKAQAEFDELPEKIYQEFQLSREERSIDVKEASSSSARTPFIKLQEKEA